MGHTPGCIAISDALRRWLRSTPAPGVTAVLGCGGAAGAGHVV